ncbi:efflux RND transporter permease subunit [Reichenbachiella sp. MALMAid0571]|uniref:efflux RND transporter permease subunit n=1 Tax=Reichenbachiella sp. MALMAid0571 TaxID=3143939 RepID=UPI0032DFC7E0
MRAVITFFVKFPIWANTIIFIAIIGGIGSYTLNLKKSFFPEREPREITISVNYPGAAPVEMEEGVTIKIEEAIKGIEGIEEVSSVSSENSAIISIRSKKDYDLEEVTVEVKNAVDRINSFPVSAEKPIVVKEKSTSGATFLSLTGDVSLFDLKKAAEQIEDDFLQSGVISQVRISGFSNLEISIEVKEQDLRRYGLTFADVASAVRQNNLDISGGTIKTSNEEIRIRANAKEFDPTVLEEIIVRANPDGTKLLLGTIANVKFQFADVPNKYFWNGKRALSISVSKLPEEDIEKISSYVDNYIEEFNANSSNITLRTNFDFNTILNQRLDLLMRNFGTGLFLVLFTLGFFLSLRLSFWVAMGIPISFFGMFIIGDLAGITINMLTLTGMLLVVGILVDDGIVIAENIFTHFKKGKTASQAAIDGTLEMVPSVFTSVATTIVAFLPLIYLDNNGFTKEMAIVVIACLGFSLIEAFFVLPSHLAHKWVLSEGNKKGWYYSFRSGMEKYIDFVRYKMYGPFVRRLLVHRWVSFTVPLVFIILVMGLFAGGIIKFTPFSRPPIDDINVDIVLKPGTHEDITERYLRQFSKQIWELHQELLADGTIQDSIIAKVNMSVGASSDRITTGSHAGSVGVEFENLDENNISGLQLGGMIREKIGNVPEAEKFTIGAANFWGKPVSISLKSKNIDDLEKIKTEIKDIMGGMPDLRDITDNASAGQRELELELKPLAYHLGLTHEEITRQIRQGFFGEEVQRLIVGTDEVRIWVRFPKEDRYSISQLESMKIKRTNGIEYPLTELVDYEINRGITNINHFDGKREIRVSAELATSKTTLDPILEKLSADVLPPLLAKYPGMEYTFEGQSKSGANQVDSFLAVLGPVILLMLIFITLNFRSFYQTTLILLLLPLGWACAIFGHFFHDAVVSFISIYGMLALSGVIVNDAVVMLDKYNRNLKEGMNVLDAANDAGTARFRAILLTSLTTVAGLFPLILEKSFQAQFIIPMVISLAYGVLFGTLFILFFFPVMILCFNDIKVYVIWVSRAIWCPIKEIFYGGTFEILKPGKEEVEPAIIEEKKLAGF